MEEPGKIWVKGNTTIVFASFLSFVSVVVDDGVVGVCRVTYILENKEHRKSTTLSYMLPIAQPKVEWARQVARQRVSQIGSNLTYVYIQR
jgi:hypothetical protein